jgi:hypothetical protein
MFRWLLKRPIKVTCGCRCSKHNKEIGGEDISMHEASSKEAAAIDITADNLNEVFGKAIQCGYFNEVIHYKSQNFIHLAIDPNQRGDYFKIK